MPASAQPGDEPPKDWYGNEQSFLDWREGTLALLTENLWPLCVPSSKTWRGAATRIMKDLTLADLEIVNAIRAPGRSRLFDKLPQSPLRHLNCPPHRDLFEREDGSGKGSNSDSLRSYDRQADSALFLDALPVLCNRGLSEKLNLALIFYFKDQLQRPRPFQAAMYLGKPFTHEAAKTALHPAMISGHCLQGMGMLMAVAERLELDNVPITEDSWTALSQFFVDFGDRRVMAGVHYPSDNLASWIMALDLCQHTVDPQVRHAVKLRLWRAITGRSLVFRKIEESAASAAVLSPYRLALQAFRNRQPRF